MPSNLSYFRTSIGYTVASLAVAAGVGYGFGHTWSAVLSTMLIVIILGILEVSLSFDNAVVNASILRDMSEVWRHRFITWGMVVAVFGMRLLFPLLIVAVLSKTSPWHALMLAINQPDDYARVLAGSHGMISAFGGAFLGMIGLKYFFDQEKEVHWIAWLEEPWQKLGNFEMAELAVVMIALVGVTMMIPDFPHQIQFLEAGIFGLLTFVAVEAFGSYMEAKEATMDGVRKGGIAVFLYLELLDASFSFDGVIGAFALSTNMFVIALGLGIGAMFVRSLTIMFVEHGTLTEYRFLENGAFYAIVTLAGLMLASAVIPVQEVVTGLLGAGFIGLAFYSSVRYNKQAALDQPMSVQAAE